MSANDRWKQIQSEMDRFEAEISSLGTAPKPAFIPASVRKTVISGAPTIVKPPAPTPVVISGAPKVYDMVPRQLSQSQPRSSAPSKTPGTSQENEAVAGSSLATEIKVEVLALPAQVQVEKKVVKKKKKKAKDVEQKPRKHLRSAGGQIWEDPNLLDWDPSDFRLFCGDLGNDVTDEVLTRVFTRYPSFQRAKVIRDKRTNKTKGFGFVSFKDPNDFVKAIKELDGRYVGSRPIKLRKSNWKNRNIDQARKREKERNQLLGIKKTK